MKNDKSIENQTDQLTPANKPEELTTYLTSNVIGCVNNRMTDWPFYQMNTDYYKTNDVDKFTNSAYWMTDCPNLLKDLSSDKSIQKQTDQLPDANKLRDLLTT